MSQKLAIDNKILIGLKPANRFRRTGWRSRLQAVRADDEDDQKLIMPDSLERVLFLLRWLVVGLAFAIQLYTATGSGRVVWALQLSGLAALYNSLLLALRYYRPSRKRSINLAVIDAAAVTIIIGLGGGVYSPYVLLMYLIIVEAALLFNPSGILTYTAVLAMFYATAVMVLPGQKWNELNITIVLIVVLGMFIWASVCGAITMAFEQERMLVRREQDLTAELNRQVVALSSLNHLSEQLNASLNIDELMHSTVKALPDALSVDACVALLATYDDKGTWQLGSVWYGVDEDYEPIESGQELGEQWVQAGPLVLKRLELEQVLKEGVIIRSASEETDKPAILMVPLSPDEGHGGALVLLRQEGIAFTQSDQEILAALGRQLSLLARNARLYELERQNVARLQELEQMKSDFLSAVSHELRTPLTSIKASTILLLSQPNDETGNRLLHNVNRNTERLNALVTDLLDMTKLQNGRIKLVPQAISLVDLVADVAATMRPLTDGKNQTLTLELKTGIGQAWADRRRVEQILNNLLSNAHRYTPKGGHITLTVAEVANELVVSIGDNGPGIAPHEQELVFERFYRGQTAKSGTGLGLAIARSLVELHGGRIWLTSTPTTGSTFSFTLPIASKSR